MLFKERFVDILQVFNMLFKEAKEFLNNKGYKLVESEFRDPSSYASFYYPPEGPDTEKQEEDALDAASEEINSVVESIAEGLKEKYPGVYVTADNVSSNEDGELDEDRWGWSYTETFTCKLKLEVPLKYLNLTEEGANNDDALYEALSTFFSDVANKFNKSEIDFDEIENIDYTERDKEGKYGVILLSGKYKFSYGDSADEDVDERDDY